MDEKESYQSCIYLAVDEANIIKKQFRFNENFDQDGHFYRQLMYALQSISFNFLMMHNSRGQSSQST